MSWFSEPVSLTPGFIIRFVLTLVGVFALMCVLPMEWAGTMGLCFWGWIAFMAGATKTEKVAGASVPVRKYRIFAAVDKFRIWAMVALVVWIGLVFGFEFLQFSWDFAKNFHWWAR